MQKISSHRNPHLLIALALTVVYHGALLLAGTFKGTYDALIHIFFADHYARAWFDHWEYRWYTGFTMTSYPPGSQQSIALLSPVTGLINGYIIVQLFAMIMVVIGVYRFSKIWVSEEAAGYAALLAVFASSLNETIHVFGQLPTTFSLGFLLNALPYVYRYLDEGDPKVLLVAWAANAATTAGHHVTTLFGAVFFVAPVMVLAIVEKFRTPLFDEPGAHPDKVTKENFRPLIARRLRRIVPVVLRCALYGVGMIALLLIVVLPYWLWSASDPIAQVAIPHASRDNYLVNTAAGLVFWLIPYGVGLVALPYAFYKGLITKAWPMTLSLGLLFLLGTGGTTPLPKLLLGGAYDILTLDRFTFWATIAVLPLYGEFVVSLRRRGLAKYVREQFSDFTLRVVQVILILTYLIFCIFTANLTQFRKFQPAPIDTQPIITFLQKDQHDRWRYLPLGFGDQMAWLSAQTTATTVDGNYHSARRLPAMTTTPVERLEGAKFRGIPGIGSLQQFLGMPDKYNLKYVFSNDQFYDPVLFFSGWHRVQRLENGIMVWEREDIPPLPEVLPRKEIPVYQRAMWGILPMLAIIVCLFAMTSPWWGPSVMLALRFMGVIPMLAWAGGHLRRLPGKGIPRRLFDWADTLLRRWSVLPSDDDSRRVAWQVWADWLAAIPRPKPAPPTAQAVRSLILFALFVAGLWLGITRFVAQTHDPVAIVEAYYDDLDFRRFEDAYARFDPEARPAFDQYMLELSVTNGLVASYGKLDAVRAAIIQEEPGRVVVEARLDWITTLDAYPTVEQLVLVRRNGVWFIQPIPSDVKTPPDQFFRRSDVDFLSQGRRRISAGTTAFNDVLDRPELQIMSARLVSHQTQACGFNEEDEEIKAAGGIPAPRTCTRYSVVGELINTDVDPADLTVTAFLYDADGNVLTWYNAQYAIIHKILPKEITPFRIDFEGVAGSQITDAATAGDFDPDAYSPIEFDVPIAAFEVYAKAVVTGRDLDRDVAIQEMEMTVDPDTQTPHLTGLLYNNGVQEATIPHVLVTYYDDAGQVLWVDDRYVEAAVRAQRTQPLDLTLTPFTSLTPFLEKGDTYANLLANELDLDATWSERFPAPSNAPFTSYRVTVHYFVANPQ